MNITTFFKTNRFGKIAARALLLAAASANLAPAQAPFLITSVNSGQSLDVPALSKAPGTVIEQYPLNFGANQQWTLHRVPSSSIFLPYYEIVSVNSGQALNVTASSTSPGTVITQYTRDGQSNQAWRLARAAGSAGYEIVSANQEVIKPTSKSFGQLLNLVLEVPGFSFTPGKAIAQNTESDATNQQWYLHPQSTANVLAYVSGNIITVIGWGFKPGTQACAVFNVNLIGACATVQANGNFASAALNVPPYAYVSGAKGYIVITVEDQGGNLLAVASLPGQVSPVLF